MIPRPVNGGPCRTAPAAVACPLDQACAPDTYPPVPLLSPAKAARPRERRGRGCRAVPLPPRPIAGTVPAVLALLGLLSLAPVTTKGEGTHAAGAASSSVRFDEIRREARKRLAKLEKELSKLQRRQQKALARFLADSSDREAQSELAETRRRAEELSQLVVAAVRAIRRTPGLDAASGGEAVAAPAAPPMPENARAHGADAREGDVDRTAPQSVAHRTPADADAHHAPPTPGEGKRKWWRIGARLLPGRTGGARDPATDAAKQIAALQDSIERMTKELSTAQKAFARHVTKAEEQLAELGRAVAQAQTNLRGKAEDPGDGRGGPGADATALPEPESAGAREDRSDTPGRPQLEQLRDRVSLLRQRAAEARRRADELARLRSRFRSGGEDARRQVTEP